MSWANFFPAKSSWASTVVSGEKEISPGGDSMQMYSWRNSELLSGVSPLPFSLNLKKKPSNLLVKLQSGYYYRNS